MEATRIIAVTMAVVIRIIVIAIMAAITIMIEATPVIMAGGTDRSS
jgi:hypothetical protein